MKGCGDQMCKKKVIELVEKYLKGKFNFDLEYGKLQQCYSCIKNPNVCPIMQVGRGHVKKGGQLLSTDTCDHVQSVSSYFDLIVLICKSYSVNNIVLITFCPFN